MMDAKQNFRSVCVGSVLLLAPLTGFGQWSQTSGPEGGYIGSISNINGSVVCTGGSGGIYRSTAFGAVWYNSSTELTSKRVLQAEGIGPYALAATSSEAVWYSADSGATWAASTGIPAGTVVLQISLSDSVAYASSYAGFYRSMDHGATWTFRSSEYPFPFISIGSRLVGGVGMDGIRVSDDDGATWTSSNAGLPVSYFMSQAQYPSSSSICTRDSALFISTGRGLFRSDDDGASWDLVAFGDEALPFVASSHDTLVVSRGANIQISVDDGQSWSSSVVDANHGWTRCLLMLDGRIFAGTDMGVFSTSDLGATWQRGVGLISRSFGDIAADAERIVVGGIGTDRGGMFHSSDQGTTWNPASDTSPKYSVRDLTKHDGLWFANLVLSDSNTGTSQGVYSSSDGAVTWDQVYFYPWEGLLSKGPYLFGGASNGVRRSVDGGHNWEAMTNGFPYANMFINCFATAGDVIYAGSMNFGVYRSMDQGLNWSPAVSGVLGKDVRNLAAMSGKVFASTVENGIYRSDDQGLNWYEVNAGLPNGFISDLTVADGVLIAAIFGQGIYVSGDLGAYWYPANDGLFDLDVGSITSQGTSIFAATWGSGVFSTTVAYLASSVGITERQPANDADLSIYPDPCEGEVNVAFSMDQQAVVQVQVLDLLGRHVAGTPSRTYPAGKHVLLIEIPATGPVIIKVSMDGQVRSRRIVNLGR